MPSQPRLTLPNFLRSSSPPRSPHTAPPSVFQSYFGSGPIPHASGSATAGTHNNNSLRSPTSIRPTRRDILLILLTLSFSYLFLSPTSETEYIGGHHYPSGLGDPIQSSSNQIYDQYDSYSESSIGIGSSNSNGNGNGGSKFSSWKFWPSKPSTSSKQTSHPFKCPITQITFTESVRPNGLTISELTPDSSGKLWDGGEELDEDDEVLVSRTIMKGHQPGWTLFEGLYIYDGSFYVVTDDVSQWPELRLMTSTGLPANGEPGNEESREPTGKEIKYISPLEAWKLWGGRVYKLDGMTWLWNDGQFLDHYYHFAAELLMGTWRTYTSLDPDINANGVTKLPPPKRFWFLHQHEDEWRDNPGFNTVLTFALFPSTAMLYPRDFADLEKVTSQGHPKAFMLEKALLADRSAAFRGPFTGPTSRTVASACQVGTASRWWWEPIRRQMLRYSGVSEDIINRSLEGYGAIDPAVIENPAESLATLGPGFENLEPLAPAGDYIPLVTYISRQNSRRHLTAESHQDLVNAMEERAKKVGFDFMIVEAEKLTKEEQIALAARTTILLGVHGNGLTHLIWMPATPRSAVIEMFIDKGFARDYQWTAHALGIRHYAIQHDKSFTAPNTAQVDYPEGFQGPSITVVGKVVADIVEERLAGKV